MTSNHDWLERLSAATDYEQLQAIFADMATEARLAVDKAGWVESIDEAIRRIEQERTRDETELKAIEANYAAFKNEQSGFVGWFKRHVPFSETRRTERGHRDSIGDQNAEIHANNLVIARAQMLKQGLLPPNARPLGHPPEHWRATLSSHDSIQAIAQYGESIIELSNEMTIAERFITDIRHDIDAFLAVEFTANEDRQRQQKDIQAANHELAALANECDQKGRLLTDALKHVGGRISEELELRDVNYYSLVQRIKQLQYSSQHAQSATAAASKIAEHFKTLTDLSQRSDKTAIDQRELEQHLQKQRGDLASAKHQLMLVERQMSNATTSMQDAKNRAEQAEAGYQAAKRIVDQHVSASPVPADVTSQPLDPVAVEFKRLERERDVYQEAARVAAAPYVVAETQYRNAKTIHDKLDADIAALQRKQEELIRSAQETEKLTAELTAQIPLSLAAFEPVLNDYLISIETLDLDSQALKLTESFHRLNSSGDLFGSRNRFSVAVNVAKETEAFYGKIVDSLGKDQRELARRLAEAASQRQESWQRRCHQLLSPAAAGLVIGKGLAAVS